MKQGILHLIVILVFSAGTIWADEWPQMNGLHHNRISTESIEIDWDSNKPSPNWRVRCNGGFSSFVVAEGKVFTVLMNKMGGELREVVVALDRSTGKALWNTGLGKAGYDPGGNRGTSKNNGGDGPRATDGYSSTAVSSSSTAWTAQPANSFGCRIF